MEGSRARRGCALAKGEKVEGLEGGMQGWNDCSGLGAIIAECLSCCWVVEDG